MSDSTENIVRNLVKVEFLRLNLSKHDRETVPMENIVLVMRYLTEEYMDNVLDLTRMRLQLCSDVVPYVRIVFDQEFPDFSPATAEFLSTMGWRMASSTLARRMIFLDIPTMEPWSH